MIKKLFQQLFVFVLFIHFVSAQNKLLTIQDAVLKGRSTLAPKRLQNLVFIPESNKTSYIDKNTVFVLEPTKGDITYSLDLNTFNQKLKAQKMDSLKAWDGFKWKDENSFYFKSAKKEWVYITNTQSLEVSDRKTSEAGLENLEEFIAGDSYAYVKGNNVFVFNSGKTQQITQDGSYTIVNGKSVHRDEFGIHKGLFWSPNGNLLAYYKMDQVDVSDYPIIDWSVYPAENKNIKYPMAGSKKPLCDFMGLRPKNGFEYLN